MNYDKKDLKLRVSPPILLKNVPFVFLILKENLDQHGAEELKIQSPLVIVDSSVGGKMSTITSNSTITRELHTKIDNWSAKSVHYNEKFHYYGVHYYERRLYID